MLREHNDTQEILDFLIDHVKGLRYLDLLESGFYDEHDDISAVKADIIDFLNNIEVED